MKPASLPTLLLLLAAACSGPQDPEDLVRSGVHALNAREFQVAYADLHQAVRALPTEHPRALEAHVSLCRALVHRDPDVCVQELRALSAERTDLEAKDVELVARDLSREKAFMAAAEALEVGLSRWPDSERLHQLLDEAGAAAEKGDDPEAVKRMKSLGYTGGKD